MKPTGNSIVLERDIVSSRRGKNIGVEIAFPELTYSISLWTMDSFLLRTMDSFLLSPVVPSFVFVLFLFLDWFSTKRFVSGRGRIRTYVEGYLQQIYSLSL